MQKRHQTHARCVLAAGAAKVVAPPSKIPTIQFHVLCQSVVMSGDVASASMRTKVTAYLVTLHAYNT
jgi:hypothetical protein